MDTNNLQVASTSAAKSSLPKYTFKRPYPQCFSLPYPIIKYMIKNPQSGKVWKKLILSCKFFYSKYPVFPVIHLRAYRDSKCIADGEIFDSSKHFPKLWLYDSLRANYGSYVSSLFSKSIILDFRYLYMYDQDLTFDDYLKLTSSASVEQLSLIFCSIKNADGSIVTADKLLENLQHLEQFVMFCLQDSSLFEADTVKKMVEHLNRFKNIYYINMIGIDESFDFASFADFLLKNKTVDIRLSYQSPVSAEYKEMVENVIKEVEKKHSLKVPAIHFNG